MNFQPIEDRILVKQIQDKESEKTESGIILDMVKKETAKGEVIAVGLGRYATETGTFIPNVLAKGDIVLYGINQGMDITVEGEKLKILREGDILLFVEQK
jgi:co-chaperonin GroES (HSP10)